MNKSKYVSLGILVITLGTQSMSSFAAPKPPKLGAEAKHVEPAKINRVAEGIRQALKKISNSAVLRNNELIERISDSAVAEYITRFFEKSEPANLFKSEDAAVQRKVNDIFDTAGKVSSFRSNETKTSSRIDEVLVEGVLAIPKLHLLGEKAANALGIKLEVLKEVKDILDGVLNSSPKSVREAAETIFNTLKEKGKIDQNEKFENWYERLIQCLKSLI